MIAAYSHGNPARSSQQKYHSVPSSLTVRIARCQVDSEACNLNRRSSSVYDTKRIHSRPGLVTSKRRFFYSRGLLRSPFPHSARNTHPSPSRSFASFKPPHTTIPPVNVSALNHPLGPGPG